MALITLFWAAAGSLVAAIIESNSAEVIDIPLSVRADLNKGIMEALSFFGSSFINFFKSSIVLVLLSAAALVAVAAAAVAAAAVAAALGSGAAGAGNAQRVCDWPTGHAPRAGGRLQIHSHAVFDFSSK